MGDYYSGTISALGAHKSNAQDFQDEYDAVLNQITTLRQSVQGVVTDEELTELIKFQRAYGAAATLIQTVDEMMETVINMAAG
jgi:flagellar hook-associated protein 1 FlgK